MIDRPTDRLWPPSLLSDAERARAKLALDSAPSRLEEMLYGSIVGDLDTKFAAIDGVLRSVRCEP